MTKCPRCDGPLTYVGFSAVECATSSCPNWDKMNRKPDLAIVLTYDWYKSFMDANGGKLYSRWIFDDFGWGYYTRQFFVDDWMSHNGLKDPVWPALVTDL